MCKKLFAILHKLYNSVNTSMVLNKITSDGARKLVITLSISKCRRTKKNRGPLHAFIRSLRGARALRGWFYTSPEYEQAAALFKVVTFIGFFGFFFIAHTINFFSPDAEP